MSYNQYNSNPYSQGPPAEEGYAFRYGAQPAQEQHEMQPYGAQGQQQQSPGLARPEPTASIIMSQNDFLANVQFMRGEIRKLTADVKSIATLHQRALQGDNQAQAQLDEVVSQTTMRNTKIRSQIKALKSDVEMTSDPAQFSMKSRHWNSLNEDFKTELQGYLNEERQYQQTYREQISRQYRIANPDATEEEVQDAATRDWSDQGVFQQALSTNRFAQGQAALGAVRQRHDEMKKIEQQIIELAAMFQDLDTLVLQQAPVIERAEEQTSQAANHIKESEGQIKKSAALARHRRKLKWWCLLVVILILIAIGVGVGVGVTAAQNAAKAANGNR